MMLLYLEIAMQKAVVKQERAQTQKLTNRGTSPTCRKRRTGL
jgi:hypothetical protein